MSKTVVLASNRTGVFEEIKNIPFLRLKHVFAVENSPLHRQLDGATCTLIREGAHRAFLDELSSLDFDFLISNGCPVIVPVTKIKKEHQRFLNVHPSLLPELRGFHPANGALLYNAKEAGATLHTMVDRVDRGGIIHQERFSITADLDLGLLYHLLFRAEARVFERGIKKLFACGFDNEGEAQPHFGSQYRRTAEDMRVDFETMGDEEILRRVRSFGVTSQGALCRLEGTPYKLLEASAIKHPFLLELYAAKAPGSVVLSYDGGLLIRSLESLIRVSKYTKI